jgi:hypothetical protein
MARRQAEDRYTWNGRPVPMAQVRMDDGELRWVPAEGGAVRGARASVTPGAVSHAAHSGTHTHVHASYSQGGPARHEHMHTHSGDANHDHRHNDPGQPGPGMPDVALGANSAALAGAIRGYLASEGIDPDEALAEAARRRGYAAGRARGSREEIRRRVTGVALQLRQARRALRFELGGWQAQRPGCSLAQVIEAENRVSSLEAEWRAVTCNDEALQAAVWAAIR